MTIKRTLVLKISRQPAIQRLNLMGKGLILQYSQMDIDNSEIGMQRLLAIRVNKVKRYDMILDQSG